MTSDLVLPQYEPLGYPMVDSFTIRNFRNFLDVEVKDCQRINIIVGDNGSGKTALLEALYLALGVTPELLIRTRSWRGVEGGGQMHGTPERIHEELWGDIFFNFNTQKSAVISLKGPGHQTRKVTVSLNKLGQGRPVAPPRGKPQRGVVIERNLTVPIDFRWAVQGRADFSIQPTFVDGKLIFPTAPDAPVQGAFYAANRMPPAYEMVDRFSALSRRFKERDFIEKFRGLFNKITGLSIEVGFGTPSLFGTVEGLSQKIPISLASGGMTKLASILLSFPEMGDGVILIDEIESGFYYERLPLVWMALYEFAHEYNCQIFASTHSLECLNSVADLVKESPADFSLLRTVQTKNGGAVRHFGGDQFASAIDAHIEIR